MVRWRLLLVGLGCCLECSLLVCGALPFGLVIVISPLLRSVCVSLLYVAPNPFKTLWMPLPGYVIGNYVISMSEINLMRPRMTLIMEIVMSALLLIALGIGSFVIFL